MNNVFGFVRCFWGSLGIVPFGMCCDHLKQVMEIINAFSDECGTSKVDVLSRLALSFLRVVDLVMNRLTIIIIGS